MLYLTKHEKSLLLFLAAVALCGSVADMVFKTMPSVSRAMVFEDRFVHKTDINTADYDELLRVPYIGEVTARAIIAYRQDKGRIRSLEEIRSIPVIYPSNFEKMVKYLKL